MERRQIFKEFYSYFSTNGRFTRKLFRQNLRVERKVPDSETHVKNVAGREEMSQEFPKLVLV